MAVTTWHIIGYIWKENSIYLQVRDLPPKAMTQDLALTGNFYLRKTGETRCTGWIDFSCMEILACPDMARVKHQQCDRCKQREGFMPCMLCKGTNCPSLKPVIQAYCRQTHHLYLACFGNEQIKVGTAADIRKRIRILEQGPLAAAYVATAPGPIIKQIEHEVSLLGYPEAMRRMEKRALLTSGMKDSQARQLLLTAFEDISSRLPPRHQQYLHEPEIAERPLLATASRDFRYLVDLVPTTDRFVGGHVIAASGHLLIVDPGSGPPAVLDLTSLKSAIVEVDMEKSYEQPAKQLMLF